MAGDRSLSLVPRGCRFPLPTELCGQSGLTLPELLDSSHRNPHAIHNKVDRLSPQTLTDDVCLIFYAITGAVPGLLLPAILALSPRLCILTTRSVV